MMTSSNANIFRVTGPLCGEFTPSQRPEARSFDVFFDMRLNKRLSKQSRRRWFETPSSSLWRHCNDNGNVVLLTASHRSLLCFSTNNIIRVRSHVRFVRNPHGLLHFWLVTFQQEWSHGVRCGAVRPANQAKKLPQPPCQKLPQRPLRLKRDSPNTR